jgi:uncharacterized protein (DUF1330 family)
MSAYGSKYLARGGRMERLERASEWLNSLEYGEVKPLRHRAAVSKLVAIEEV